MSDAVDHAERGPRSGRTVRSRSLPVAVWIAPVAWFVHLSAGMVLGPAACEWGSELPLHLLSTGCIVAALVGGALLLRYRTEDAATRFIARMGLGFAALSLLAMLVVTAATVPIDGCDL